VTKFAIAKQPEVGSVKSSTKRNDLRGKKNL